MKRRYKILLLGLLAVIALVWLLLPSGNSRRAVEAYKAQLIAKGEKLTMAELAPPTTPEGITAGRKFTNLMMTYTAPADYPATMKFIAPGMASTEYSNIPPTLMASYASNSALAAQLRQILDSPTLDFNPDYSMGANVPLIDHLSPMKSSTRLLSITALQAMHERDYSEAWSNLIAEANLVRLWRNEPILISALIRLAVAQISLASSWAVLQESQWTDAQLADLQARWESTDFTDSLGSIVAMERAFGIDEFANTRTQDYEPRAIDMSFLVNGAGGSTGLSGTGGVVGTDDADSLYERTKRGVAEFYDRHVSFPVWKSSWSYNEELFLIQSAGTVHEAVRQIWASGSFLEALHDLESKGSNIARLYSSELPHFRTSVDYTSLFGRYFTRVASTESSRRMLIVAIALKRFQLQRNAYPASLNELVPEFLKQVPMDPWDGKPLRYKLKPDGTFLLYSIGEDGVDNGGDASVPPGTLNDWMGGRDIVWPRAATPAEVENFQRSQTNGISTNKVEEK